MQPVMDELARMMELEFITRVNEPTDRYAEMVVVPKSDKKVRIYVSAERHRLPAVEQSLSQLAGARVFSTLDANSGFWPIPLEQKSALLTTFITPFGRYCFHPLLFGMTSAPEYFQ